jgi:hypothetical protein
MGFDLRLTHLAINLAGLKRSIILAISFPVRARYR